MELGEGPEAHPPPIWLLERTGDPARRGNPSGASTTQDLCSGRGGALPAPNSSPEVGFCLRPPWDYLAVAASSYLENNQTVPVWLKTRRRWLCAGTWHGADGLVAACKTLLRLPQHPNHYAAQHAFLSIPSPSHAKSTRHLTGGYTQSREAEPRCFLPPGLPFSWWHTQRPLV